jgi:hypothetical protein
MCGRQMNKEYQICSVKDVTAFIDQHPASRERPWAA